jgi:hypothetical protein
MPFMWNSSFDFPRLQEMAIIWHSPYVGMQLSPPPLKITNQMWLSVTCPNPWNPNVDAYQLVDILQLVIFYNDDLGINAGDLVYVMRQKVRVWLVEE